MSSSNPRAAHDDELDHPVSNDPQGIQQRLNEEMCELFFRFIEKAAQEIEDQDLALDESDQTHMGISIGGNPDTEDESASGSRDQEDGEEVPPRPPAQRPGRVTWDAKQVAVLACYFFRGSARFKFRDFEISRCDIINAYGAPKNIKACENKWRDLKERVKNHYSSYPFNNKEFAYLILTDVLRWTGNIEYSRIRTIIETYAPSYFEYAADPSRSEGIRALQVEGGLLWEAEGSTQAPDL